MGRQDELGHPRSWIIYRVVADGVVTGPPGVCEQDEWEAMERAHPGGTFVVQSGIADERVAVALAGGDAGDAGDPVSRVWQDGNG